MSVEAVRAVCEWMGGMCKRYWWERIELLNENDE